MKWRFWQWERITRFNESPEQKDYDGKPTENDYLYRLKVFQCPWFGVFLHWFVSSDDECQHDHPWKFVSIILSGGYWEQGPDGKTTWYPPGSILRRMDPTRSHRVIVDKPAMTLVIIGPKKRTWGFHTLLGWIPWYHYKYSQHCSE